MQMKRFLHRTYLQDFILNFLLIHWHLLAFYTVQTALRIIYTHTNYLMHIFFILCLQYSELSECQAQGDIRLFLTIPTRNLTFLFL